MKILEYKMIKREDLFDTVKDLHLINFFKIGQTYEKLRNGIVNYNLDNICVYDKDRAVGYILFNIKTDFCYMCWMAVDEEYRGKGISKDLITRVEKYCQETGIKRLGMDTRNRYKVALISYLKSGYDIIGVENSDNGEKLIKLEKVLD